MRRPYVGSGSSGARRSAQIDREEADVEPNEERRAMLLESARQWDEQADRIARYFAEASSPTPPASTAP